MTTVLCMAYRRALIQNQHQLVLAFAPCLKESLHVVDLLFSAKIISEEKHHELLKPLELALVYAVQEKVNSEPQYFEEFIRVLRKDLQLEELATKLERDAAANEEAIDGIVVVLNGIIVVPLVKLNFWVHNTCTMLLIINLKSLRIFNNLLLLKIIIDA